MPEKNIKKLKILILSDYGYVEGGTGKVAISSAIKLAEIGHEVVFFSAVGPVSEDLLKSKVKNVICIGQKDILFNPNKIDAILSGTYNWRAINGLKKLFKEWVPDVAHIHGITKALSWAAINIIYKQKIPIVFTLHDYGLLCPNLGAHNFKTDKSCDFYKPGCEIKCLMTNCDKRSYLHKLWRWIRFYFSMHILKANKKISGYVAVSSFMENFFKEYIPRGRHTKVIYSPVDMTYFGGGYNLDEKYKGIPTFLFLGRLSYEKGLDLALEAINGLNARLLIVGDGALKEYCIEKARGIGTLNGIDKVEFLGWQKEEQIVYEMNRCWAILLPSRVKESGGLVILEAAKYSLPAIVSESGAFTGFVNDKKDGYYFKPCTLISLMKSMYKVISDPQRTKIMGENARKKFLDISVSVEKHTTELEKFYYEVIKN
jgi:glycosyltransferase involved in cell wall biosynthesis